MSAMGAVQPCGQGISSSRKIATARLEMKLFLGDVKKGTGISRSSRSSTAPPKNAGEVASSSHHRSIPNAGKITQVQQHENGAMLHQIHAPVRLCRMTGQRPAYRSLDWRWVKRWAFSLSNTEDHRPGVQPVQDEAGLERKKKQPSTDHPRSTGWRGLGAAWRCTPDWRPESGGTGRRR